MENIINFNNNNLALKTNFIAGSEELSIAPIFLTSFSLPSFQFSHPEIGGRLGVKLHVSADYGSFNTLSLECLIDENYQILFNVLDIIKKSYNKINGTFANRDFNLWIQVFNSKGNPLYKIDFINCRLNTFGEINFSTQEDTEFNTFNIELVFDYYEIVKNDKKENFNTFFKET